jgi:ATPase subunit of ABC transporter with duplicated ATPase domains
VLLGKNGTGKSVFLRLLVAAYEAQKRGADPGAGLRINPQLELGYYDQSLERIPSGARLSDIVRDALNLPQAAVSRALVRAGFAVLEHDKRANHLSGGERARLQFLLLSLQQPSLLVLDEPTNHIDIEGCENLESEIIEREATTLFVSHDRRFVANVATRFLLVEGGALREVASPDEYYASEREDSAHPPERGGSVAQPDLSGPRVGSVDEVLARILELEEKLKADRRQKPERQNAARQMQLQAEISSLYGTLDAAAASEQR